MRVLRSSAGLGIVLVLIVRLAFLMTYPLNDFGGDAHNYLTMLLLGHSSLVHAGGYPFLLGLPFRIPGVQGLLAAVLPYVILIVQHLLDVLALLFMYRVAADVYGKAAGFIALVLEGLSLQRLSATSATYPEWLQADLLVVALGITYYAFVETSYSRKLSLYGAAAFAFSWCMLVKFNVAVVGFFLVVAIAADSVGVKRKMAMGFVSALVCAGTFVPYTRFYQYATTGSYALTYDTAWVLLTRIQGFYQNTLDPMAGLDTRRWLALSAVLPRSYEQAGPGLFSHVNAVPPEVRAPYRARFGYLLHATDQATRLVLARHRLPDGFSVGLSAIPVAYYIGLRESDHLGTRVALEAIRAHPLTYFSGVFREVQAALRGWPNDVPFASSGSLAFFGTKPATRLAIGYVRVTQRPDWSNVPFSFSVPVLWWPGVRLFTMLEAYGPPAYWPSVAVGVAFLLASVRAVLVRRIDLQTGSTLLIATMAAVMLVVSVATLAFRWKEARVVMPLASVLAGAAVAHVLSIANATGDGRVTTVEVG